MALFGGHYNRKPRQFEYRPLYYDPEKEERERRRRLMKLRKDMEEAAEQDDEALEQEEEQTRAGDIIRRKFGADREFRAEMERQRKRKNMRTIALIFILSLAMIWILNNAI